MRDTEPSTSCFEEAFAGNAPFHNVVSTVVIYKAISGERFLSYMKQMRLIEYDRGSPPTRRLDVLEAVNVLRKK